MDAKLSIKKFRDPNKGNWDVNITGQYLNVVGKIYDFKRYKEADKIKDANGNPTDKTANNGYYSGKGELTNLINPAEKPFINPVTNQQVTLTSIQADFEDMYGWEQTQTMEWYRSYVYSSIQKSLEKKYKEAFGVEIELKIELLPEEKKDSEPPKQPTENQQASTGTIAKYLSTGASNNGVPMEITYEIVKDGISVYKSQMTTGFKYDEKTKKITIVSADTFYDKDGKWVDKNGKDPFVTKDQILALEGYPPAPADSGTSGTNGTSGTGPKIYGEFTFDIQEQETFAGKDFGKLILIAKGVVNVPVVEIPEEESIEILDEGDEYSEESFVGDEEVPPEISKAEFIQMKNLDDTAKTPGSADTSADTSTGTSTGTSTETNAVQPEVSVAAIGKWNKKVTKQIEGDTWESRAANFIALKEGFTGTATWDVNHYRMGYGTDHVVKIGKDGKPGSLVEVKKGDTITKKEAVLSLSQYGIPQFTTQLKKDLGQSNWNKLTGNQKAAITSLGYNVGQYFISAKGYGKKLKAAVEKGDFEAAALVIFNGPRTANGKVLSGLVQRRTEEAQLFLHPDSKSIYA